MDSKVDLVKANIESRKLRYAIKETNKILLRIAMALEKWNEPLQEIREFEPSHVLTSCNVNGCQCEE